MSKSLDRLTLLDTFTRIAERGSISAAARDLGLSQASASRQLKELETRLNVDLIHRTTHDLSLTTAGEQCLADARALLAGWSSLIDRHNSPDGALEGHLKVVAPVALGQRVLADAIIAFQKTHPHTSINWVLTDDPIRFTEFGCDLWIKVGAVQDESLVVREAGRIERLVVAAPSLIQALPRGTPKALVDLPCVAIDSFEGSKIPLTSHKGRTEILDARAVLTTNNVFAAHRAALDGIGYVVLPRWFVDDELSNGQLLDVLPNWRCPELPLSVAYLPSRHQTRLLKTFIERIQETIGRTRGLLSDKS